MRGTKVEKCFSRQELNNQAKVEMVDSTPLRFYIRTADHLYKQAKIYQKEGDLTTSYILYMKFCNLVVYELQKHSDYNNPDYKGAIASLRKSALVAMNEIADLKPILDKKYDDYLDYIRQRDAMLVAEAQEAQQQLESQRRQDMERTSREQQELYWANNPPTQGWSLVKALEGVPGVNSTQLMQHNQAQLHDNAEIQYPEHHHRSHHHHHTHHHKPEIPSPSIRPQQFIPTPTGPPPALPRKPVLANNAPKLPPKVQIEEDVHGVFRDTMCNRIGEQLLNSTLTRSILSFSIEFSQGLRTLIVPVRLLDRFLNIVRPNTIKNMETCGILAGVLSRNKLTVTTLIIPKQTATSDTCSTTNEDELFEFQNERDLMTLGWIHTHPTQTCFMSSVDLHTHCSYQLMLPEAIAIVCAPSHDRDYGVFRLTDPPGLQVITNCRQKPLFHQHPGEDDIYTDACDQGHVELVDQDLEIVDLRKL
ncbi:hypothetical protein EDD21DRAFT_382276 [Dissophora ornata]|nr:hypothetical protein EDD21DRAFT_382276 [Dissophora ornata]